MTWVNAVLQGVLLGGLYALFATGLSLVFGVMRLVNLAHGDLAVLGAYLALVVVQGLSVGPLVGLLAVVPALAAVGYLLQRGLLDRSLRAGPLAPLLVTSACRSCYRTCSRRSFRPTSAGCGWARSGRRRCA